MQSKFVVIDSFRITQQLMPRLAPLTLGTWFVMEGTFPPDASLPPLGLPVAITKPSGEVLHSHVSGSELRHGALAFQFAAPEISELPRHSVVSTHDSGPLLTFRPDAPSA